MDIGIGLDSSLGLSLEEMADASAESARAGYTSIWMPDTAGMDSFQMCLLRWQATRSVVPAGLTTGISVSPVAVRSPMGLAISAGTLSRVTDGRFILGIGAGAAYTQAYRDQWGIRGDSVIGYMREHLVTIRGLLAGEAVTHEGENVTLRGAKLGIEPPPRTPVYLAALGPQMLRLGGELADGLALNWCSAEQVAWSRRRVAEGAARAGRDPASIVISEYIRVCVDDDVDLARRAFAKATMGYALGFGSPQAPGARPQSYRAHFERMGFADDLARIDDMRRKNAPAEDVLDAFPEALLKTVGYFGAAAGAAAHFRSVAEGLDTAVVRVVAARPGIDSTRAVLRACAPGAGAEK